MDKLTALQVFLSVAETGSFTQTAERLGISKPMISRYIALMEDWLNARLLQRTTRKVSLTDAGEQAAMYCQEMIALQQEMENKISAYRGELRGNIRIACNTSFGSNQLTQAIHAFLALHPKLNVQLQLSDNAVDLVENRIDLAIRFTNNPDPNLVARKLGECHSLFVASPTYLAEHGTPKTPNDLKHHTYLAHSNVNHKSWSALKSDEKIDLELTSRFTTNDTFSLLNMVLSHNGIAMLPKYMLTEHLENQQLEVVLPDWEATHHSIYALYPTRHKLPLTVRALIDFLVERFGKEDW